MNKIEKFLKKLTAYERSRVHICLEKIIAQDWAHLDIKKLKMIADVYRVRLGTIRIIFRSAGEKNGHHCNTKTE